MNSIKKFKVDISYSDHTLGVEVSFAAVSLGAKIIEKHITLNRNLSGPHHKASLEPKEFRNLVKGIRNISLALGKVRKNYQFKIKNLTIVRKSIVAKKEIRKVKYSLRII